ncbi:hypothetical protein [Jeotgalibacillus salarius]|uniref:DUF2642 domain-containing protein n=1 Tax=Jeotgalibacillus salarius TaxID=546023 RepID=A0A4Y8LHG0_9BACL|nr:hypothetical protein [Jeotgalibacillus salarius]TFE01617.1 hypothetical protein E2626_08585 [Jeotgalibacillus salarius]
MKALSSNERHEEGLIQFVSEHAGAKMLAMTSSFPYFFIGRIIKVMDDYVILSVETTNVAELENREWHLHIHDIEVFYIERDGWPAIPDLKETGGDG